MTRLDARDWSVVEALQEGIPLVPRPYDVLAERAGMDVGELLARIAKLREEGVIRRMGFRVGHRQTGTLGNIMVVWRVPEERVCEVGELLASSEAVSHCYERPQFEGFPYNVYSMVHAATEAQAIRVARDLAARCGIEDYEILRTVREWKKSTPVYHRPWR